MRGIPQVSTRLLCLDTLFKPQRQNAQFVTDENEFKSTGNHNLGPLLDPLIDSLDGINLCEVYTVDDFAWAREEAPLTKRAWIFQERLLSPRTLYFFTQIAFRGNVAAKDPITEYLPFSNDNAQGPGFDANFVAEYIREDGDL